MINLHKNLWNPFIPTEKDLEKTKYLADKNPVIAGILSFIFFPAGLFYLHRAVNSLKILGYVIVASIILSLGAETEEDFEDISNLISFLGIVALTTEQVITVNKARTRLQENYTSTGEQFNMSSMSNMDDKYARLKELKRKHKNNEISAEEFKVEKQKIIDSV